MPTSSPSARPSSPIPTWWRGCRTAGPWRPGTKPVSTAAARRATWTIPSMAEDIADVIARFNAGRDPERLAMKYRAMRTNAFIFLRGTCHLFYAGLPDVPLLRDAPAAWACGDLHLQNYGSYKGDDRLVYFDINDFDE